MPGARWFWLAASLLLPLSGCGGQQDAAISGAADGFSAAVRSGNGVQACVLLAPLTRQELESSEQAACEQAVLGVDLPQVDRVVDVDRYGREGSARLHGAGGQRDTYFLSRFGQGWLVSAAGCDARGELPYDCDVEGP